MTTILEADARLTAQNQITIPAVIRNALNLRGGKSQIKFELVTDRGETLVVIRAQRPKARQVNSKEDPALKPFLALLEKSIRKAPLKIRPVSAQWVAEAQALVHGVEVELDGPLTGED